MVMLTNNRFSFNIVSGENLLCEITTCGSPQGSNQHQNNLYPKRLGKNSSEDFNFEKDGSLRLLRLTHTLIFSRHQVEDYIVPHGHFTLINTSLV